MFSDLITRVAGVPQKFKPNQNDTQTQNKHSCFSQKHHHQPHLCWDWTRDTPLSVDLTLYLHSTNFSVMTNIFGQDFWLYCYIFILFQGSFILLLKLVLHVWSFPIIDGVPYLRTFQDLTQQAKYFSKTSKQNKYVCGQCWYELRNVWWTRIGKGFWFIIWLYQLPSAYCKVSRIFFYLNFEGNVTAALSLLFFLLHPV